MPVDERDDGPDEDEDGLLRGRGDRIPDRWWAGPGTTASHPGYPARAFRCPAIRLAASCCEQDACQTYLRTARPGGMVGPASAVWGQQRAAGIPRMGTVQPTEGIARGFRHSQVTTLQRAVTDADENGPVRAPTENQAAGSPGPAVGGSGMTASKIDPPAEDARGADLYRHHFSVRRRSVPDLGADRSRSMHRHPRANHLRVLPAADFGRDEFGGQGFASALRPRPSDDHGAPFSIRGAQALFDTWCPSRHMRQRSAAYVPRLDSTYCVGFDGCAANARSCG